MTAAPPKIKKIPAYLAPLLEKSGAEFKGAACAGASPLFDLETKGETKAQREARHHKARALCRRCQVLDKCRQLADGLPKSQRQGVWAGDLYGHDGKRVPPPLPHPLTTHRRRLRKDAA